MLALVEIVPVGPELCPFPPTDMAVVVVECCDTNDEDDGELPNVFPPIWVPVVEEFVAAAAPAVAVELLDGVFELRTCAHVSFDGEGYGEDPLPPVVLLLLPPPPPIYR